MDNKINTILIHRPNFAEKFSPILCLGLFEFTFDPHFVKLKTETLGVAPCKSPFKMADGRWNLSQFSCMRSATAHQNKNQKKCAKVAHR